jgi:hypothetical protein
MNRTRAVYDWYEYDKEKRQAMETWGRVLAGILEPVGARPNVVPITAAR